MNDLVFLDTETTGLNPDIHEVWEIAWAVNDDAPVQAMIVPHSLATADLEALRINHYWDRARAEPAHTSIDLDIRHLLEGNTLVCANPTFDRMFLRKRWGVEPYRYRSIDIESIALAVFGWDRPKGLKDIADELNSRGYNIGEPNHSAWIDVVVLREAYKALRKEIVKRDV